MYWSTHWLLHWLTCWLTMLIDSADWQCLLAILTDHVHWHVHFLRSVLQLLHFKIELQGFFKQKFKTKGNVSTKKNPEGPVVKLCVVCGEWNIWAEWLSSFWKQLETGKLKTTSGSYHNGSWIRYNTFRMCTTTCTHSEHQNQLVNTTTNWWKHLLNRCRLYTHFTVELC